MMGGGYVPQQMARPGMAMQPVGMPYGAAYAAPYGPNFAGAAGFGGAAYGSHQLATSAMSTSSSYGNAWGQPQPVLTAPQNLQMPQLQAPGRLELPMLGLGVPTEMQQELATKDLQLRELVQQAGALQQTLQAEHAQQRLNPSTAATGSESSLTMPPEAAAELKRMEENLSSTAAEGGALAADIANAAQISEQLNAWFETNKSQMGAADESGSPSQYLQTSLTGLKQQMDGLMCRWQQIQTVFGSAGAAPTAIATPPAVTTAAAPSAAASVPVPQARGVSVTAPAVATAAPATSAAVPQAMGYSATAPAVTTPAAPTSAAVPQAMGYSTTAPAVTTPAAPTSAAVPQAMVVRTYRCDHCPASFSDRNTAVQHEAQCPQNPTNTQASMPPVPVTAKAVAVVARPVAAAPATASQTAPHVVTSAPPAAAATMVVAGGNAQKAAPAPQYVSARITSQGEGFVAPLASDRVRQAPAQVLNSSGA